MSISIQITAADNYPKLTKYLEDNQITVTSERIGLMVPEWDKPHKHDTYEFTISTPRGKYSSTFYASRASTETRLKYTQYLQEHTHIYPINKAEMDKQAAMKKRIAECEPAPGDILSCLTWYNPGTFDDWCNEFGYDNDSIKAFHTYQACSQEYLGLCRIFTEDQREYIGNLTWEN